MTLVCGWRSWFGLSFTLLEQHPIIQSQPDNQRVNKEMSI